ncbi:serine hydrolase [Amycolatopsis cynarae]|uniref:Serine hydrolase n=1 Tax=Amycolatopsis cynarae TaxID=2995223 RepID=A0ABY7AY98_9PSEU|nr:serine hydrolase domain-containing protein [Amycolatopsis sp. HUAS 11-8]WAL64685.1 serine hydrolase [Amycolatopsis sp. HUAS 11-8]
MARIGMRRLGVALGAIAVAATVGAPGSAVAAQAADHAGVQTVLEGYQAHTGPGAAVHAGDASHSWDLHVGPKVVNTNQFIGPNDAFRAASQTKTFTAAVVLQLVDEGKVALDSPIERYLPGVVDGNGYDGNRITVRQILQQTSGVNGYSNASAASDGTYDLRELIRAGLAANPPKSDPVWNYSNINYYIAGLLIEQITSMPARDAITDRIIRPLGLSQTSLPAPGDKSLPGAYVHGYRGGTSGPFYLWLDTTFGDWGSGIAEPSYWSTAGALVSTLSDLAAFDQDLLNGKVVSPASLAEMRKTVATGAPGLEYYGLGLWAHDLSCGGQAWGLLGDLSTGYSSATMATDDGRHAAVVTNTFADGNKPTRVDVLDAALCDKE